MVVVNIISAMDMTEDSDVRTHTLNDRTETAALKPLMVVSAVLFYMNTVDHTQLMEVGV